MAETVKTREELEAAKDNGVHEILVLGELADKVKKAQKISQMGKVGLATLTVVLGASAVTAPLTGGVSLGAAAAASAMTGVGVAAIITASALGIGLVLAIYKDYEEIEYSHGTLRLRKKQKDD